MNLSLWKQQFFRSSKKPSINSIEKEFAQHSVYKSIQKYTFIVFFGAMFLLLIAGLWMTLPSFLSQNHTEYMTYKHKKENLKADIFEYPKGSENNEFIKEEKSIAK